MIRDSVRDLVALCQYVTDNDRKDGNDIARAESYRKIKWKQRRDAERLVHSGLDAIAIDDSNPLDTTADSLDPSPLNSADAKVSTKGEKLSKSDGDKDEPPILQFDQLMNDFLASEIEVLGIRRLPAIPSDPLGAVSIPSRREGHSLTLCHVESTSLLIVFGGRQLRDLTNLLPVAATEIDPLKLERVRYVFSNGVYSYDLETTEWRLHQCTGRQPKERSDHSAVFVAPHHLVIVGGRGRSGLHFSDMFVLSLNDWHWTELETRSQPSPRYWHGCCVASDDQLFVFGGKSDVQVYGDLQHIDIGRAVEILQRKQQQLAEKNPEWAPRMDRLRVPLSWTAPHTVGKPPSARFGLRMVRIDRDRIAFVGGWRHKDGSSQRHTQSPPRGMEVYVLDTMTMVWTKPRFSSHICRMSAPQARFLFECFATQQSVVVFGGFTYATNGETESYRLCEDDRHVLFKLDLRRMIWRRRVLADSPFVSSYPHFSSNAVLHSDDNVRVAFTCVVSREKLPIELTALDLRRPRREPSVADDAASSAVRSIGYDLTVNDKHLGRAVIDGIRD